MFARSRFLSLWLSQVSRTLADNCLRMFVVLQVAQAGAEQSAAAWYQVTPFFIVPFILLAPVNGAISNSLPKRWVLVGSAGFCLGATALAGVLLGAQSNGWLWCLALGFVAAGAAVYSPTRYALLPAVARDGRMPLRRVMGWIEMGGAAAIVAGMLLGYYLYPLKHWQEQGLSVAVAAAALLNLVGLLAALSAHFPSDVRRPEAAAQAIAGFFRDSRRIARDGEARASLLGLVCFLGLLAAGSGAVLAYTLGPEFSSRGGALPQALVFVSVGAAAGSALAGVQGHPRRALGLVPLGATGLLVALAWAATASDLSWPCLALGMMGGLVNVPLRAAYQEAVPADARGNGMAVMNTANYMFTTLTALLMFGLARLEIVTPAGQLWLLAALAAMAVLAAWWALVREALEQILEILLWACYRIHGRGPGLFELPRRGPLLLVANHTAWLDPLWLGKVIPRRITPLMTSRFYDLPVLHWLMTKVVHAIRVQAARFRREVPELQQTIGALDRGECVTIFPEGICKRRAEQSLRQFGQGVWHILRERPATPVVICWIEGGWGSYFSHCGGPPMVNKHLDWWRRIEVAVEAPQVLDPKLLADQRATRTYLMHACLAARRHLGLEPLPMERAEQLTESATPQQESTE